MKHARQSALLISFAVALLTHCNKSSEPSTPDSTGVNGQALAPNDLSNVLPVNVNGGTCGTTDTVNGILVNRACISVTICAHGTSTCQTINNILVDTGSVGLRIDKNAVTVATTPVSTSAGPLVECVGFIRDNLFAWGPLVNVDVKLGGEPATEMPVQLLDPTYASPQTACPQTASSTVSIFQGQKGLGINGYFGVGLQKHDCGASCAAIAGSVYLTCAGSTCTPTTAPLTAQMTNPISLLPIDNNGFVLTLAAVPAFGAKSSTGQIVFGIGTRENNLPTGITTLTGNGQAQINASVPGILAQSVLAYIDTGVPYLWFANPKGITVCPNNLLCPTAPVSFKATFSGVSGTASKAVTLDIGVGNSLYDSSDSVFYNLGAETFNSATVAGAGLVLGLPYLLGKTVFLAFAGASTPAGEGPFIGL